MLKHIGRIPKWRLSRVQLLVAPGVAHYLTNVELTDSPFNHAGRARVAMIHESPQSAVSAGCRRVNRACRAALRIPDATRIYLSST